MKQTLLLSVVTSLLLSACAMPAPQAAQPVSAADTSLSSTGSCSTGSCGDGRRVAEYPADTLDAPQPLPSPAAAAPGAVPAPAGYAAYTPQLLASYLGQAPVALFFHAPWCALCLQLEEQLRTHPGIASATVLQVDYDTETELKQRYRVTSQTTVVFLSADGTLDHKVINPSADEVVGFFVAAP